MELRFIVTEYIGSLRGLSLLAALFMSNQVLAEDACHPAIDNGQPQFIIGYGSLMQTESRRKDAPKSGDGHPVMVTGFQRGWNFRGSSIIPTTFLGAMPQADSHFNALVYSVPVDGMQATDKRERRYCRSAVTQYQLKMLDNSDKPSGQVWIYTVPPERNLPPNKEFPIVQSYVDIFIGGCLEIGDASHLPNFAVDCMNTTHGWSPYWVNDRIMPRRPLAYQPQALRIDSLLEETVPDLLKDRVIE